MRASQLLFLTLVASASAVIRLDYFMSFGGCSGQPTSSFYAGYGVCMPIGPQRDHAVMGDKNSVTQFQNPDCTGQSYTMQRSDYNGRCKMMTVITWLDAGNMTYPQLDSSSAVDIIYPATSVQCPGDSGVCSGQPIGASILYGQGCGEVPCTQDPQTGYNAVAMCGGDNLPLVADQAPAFRMRVFPQLLVKF
ncbi:hypothetical protein PROFUN_02910 [Planoprotostelium fungivorum]|uniref:Uncharacterized protein n=1 Tax=Planoprotostelium fungivorum TaxID=1890364 RepID=A0A2P6NS32_9EUKA|nr:hypothetical protein PROFUN_02910 [Planoprotostelium fungivorum]